VVGREVGLRLAEVPSFVDHLPSPVLIWLLGSLALPLTLALPLSLSSRRWRNWEISHLMLRASTTEASFHRVAFPGVVTQFPTCVQVTFGCALGCWPPQLVQFKY